MEVKNYYEILEIDPFASQEEIKRAYLARLKAYHPDKKNGANCFAYKRFQAVMEAYEALKTPEMRIRYDEMLKVQISQNRARKHQAFDSKNDNEKKQKNSFFTRLFSSGKNKTEI